MDLQQHYQLLEQMYLEAPIVKALYPDTSIQLQAGTATIQCPVRQAYFHAGGSLHGSVYFRMLDDAAYFAASSMEQEYFLLTADFNIKFLRPITAGTLKAEGKLTEDKREEGYYLAGARLFTGDGKIAATGSGRFRKSKKPLSGIFPSDEHEK